MTNARTTPLPTAPSRPRPSTAKTEASTEITSDLDLDDLHHPRVADDHGDDGSAEHHLAEGDVEERPDVVGVDRPEEHAQADGQGDEHVGGDPAFGGERVDVSAE